MEDKEIVKALECKPKAELIELCNRLQEKVGELEIKNSALEYDLSLIRQEREEVVKAEAYKEFAERLKERKYLDETGWSHGEHPYIVEEDDIDDVLEELAGD